MPRSRRAPTRRRSYRAYQTGRGNWINGGPQVRDAVSGIAIPRSLAVPQRGGLVDSRWHEGSRDLVDPIDRWYQPPPENVVPDPLYRLTISGVGAVLTLDEDERLDLVEDDYVWRVLGYAYPDGDEEVDLVPVYELFLSGNGDHLYTADDAEVTTALGLGYTNEGVAFYAFQTEAKNRVPLYRTVAGQSHWYTTDFAEYSSRPIDWTREGVKYYLLRGRERTLEG